jgi:hypothetical protein
MFECQGRLLNLSHDGRRPATVSFIGSLSGASTRVTDRLLLESAATQARSLEGRPLAMDSSLMLPDRSRLRVLESGPRFAAASGERRRPMPASGGQAGSRGVRRRPTLVHSEKEEESWVSECVPWVVRSSPC